MNHKTCTECGGKTCPVCNELCIIENHIADDHYPFGYRIERKCCPKCQGAGVELPPQALSDNKLLEVLTEMVMGLEVEYDGAVPEDLQALYQVIDKLKNGRWIFRPQEKVKDTRESTEGKPINCHT